MEAMLEGGMARAPYGARPSHMLVSIARASWWGAPQLSQHKPYYTAVRYKPDGSHEVVYKCAYCDVIMVSGYWVEIRNGVRYRVFGKHCPQCSVAIEEGYELMR